MARGISVEYAAGFFDGEGCVVIGSAKRTSRGTNKAWSLTAHVGQNDPEPLRRLQDVWHGTLRPRKKPNGVVHWELRLSGPEAAAFLKDIRDHTIVKTEEIDIALEFYSGVLGHSPGRAGLTKTETARRAALKEQLTLVRDTRKERWTA